MTWFRPVGLLPSQEQLSGRGSILRASLANLSPVPPWPAGHALPKVEAFVILERCTGTCFLPTGIAGMAQVVDWRSASQPREVLRGAAQALAEGRLVAFPTETVYGLAASALHPEAV